MVNTGKALLRVLHMDLWISQGILFFSQLDLLNQWSIRNGHTVQHQASAQLVNSYENRKLRRKSERFLD